MSPAARWARTSPERLGRQVEIDRDRLDLVDGDDPGGAVGSYDVAFIDLPRAGPSVDRRADLAVVQLNLSRRDRRLIDLYAPLELRDLGTRCVQLLAGAGALAGQILGTVEVEARIGQQRLIAKLSGLGLGQGSCEGLRVDFDQHVAAMHGLAFVEVDSDDLTVHPARQDNAFVGPHGTKAHQGDRNVATCGFRHHHRDCRIRLGCRKRAWRGKPAMLQQPSDAAHQREQAKNRYDKPSENQSSPLALRACQRSFARSEGNKALSGAAWPMLVSSG